MTLPQTLTGASLATIYNARPFRASNGNHYAVVLNGSGELEIFKADNGDNTWSAQDSANNPAETSINCIAAVLSGTTIHIATGNANLNPDYFYHTFSTSSDTWGTKDETIEAAVDTDLVNANQVSIDLAVRSDGSVVAVYSGDSDSVMGTAYPRVDYRIRSTGGTWGSAVAVDDAGANNYRYPRCVLGASDKIHILFVDATANNQIHKSLTSAGSLSSGEAVNDNTISPFSSYGLTYHDVGGTETIYASWVRSSDSDAYTSKIENDGTPAAEARASDSSLSIVVGNSQVSLTVDSANDTVYLAWVESVDRDIYLSKDSGSGWGNHTEILDGVTGSLIGANVYTIDSGDIVLGYVYGDTALKYNEYVVVAGGTSHAVAGSFSADFDVSSAAQVSHAAAGSYTSDIDAQSQLQVSHAALGSLDADFDAQSSLEIVLSIAGSFSTDVDVLSDATIAHAASASFAADFEAQTNLQIDHALAGLFEADYDVDSALSIQHPIDAVFDADVDVISTLLTAYQVQGGFEADVDVGSSLQIDHAIDGDYVSDLDVSSTLELQHALSASFSADLDVSSSAEVQHTLSAAFTTDFEVQSTLGIVLSISGNFDADFDTVSELLLEHPVVGEFSADLDVSSSLTVEGAITAVSGEFITDFDAQSALQVFHSIEGNFANDTDVASALFIQYAVSGGFDSDFDAESSIHIALAIAGIFDSDFDAVSELLIEHLLNALFDADFDVTSSLTVDDVIKAVSGNFDAGVDVQSAIEILWRVNGNLTGDFDVLSALLVQAGTPLTYYVGELGRYRLYKGQLSSYKLYEGQLSSYKLYIGSIEILDEVNGMAIEKAIIGQTIAPKFTLENGADNAQAFAEPDEVTMTLQWGDGTEVDYALGDITNPVLPDSGNAGVYYILAVASIEGTTKIYVNAIWDDPAWSVALNKRVEVVGQFEA